MNDTVLTITQALQLVGFTPCFFIIVFLLSLWRRNLQTIVPVFYFLSLACSFAIPLKETFLPFTTPLITHVLIFGEGTLSAFSFLLICQFILGRIPPRPYWLVLLIPLISGGAIFYIYSFPTIICGNDTSCNLDSIKTLANVFTSSFIFLLLVYFSSRSEGLQHDDFHKRHKYWLIIALILLHLMMLTVDLASLSNRITQDKADFTITMLRLTFIYLVITSLFRVFYPGLAGQVISVAKPGYNPALDKAHVEKVKILMEVDHVYREMRINRERLAKMVGIGEHHLSRIINSHFGKNFNELLNSYRIEEAKRRLRLETTQITVIGFEVGFNSIASFNRVFKAIVGQSPTQYRNDKGVNQG